MYNERTTKSFFIVRRFPSNHSLTIEIRLLALLVVSSMFFLGLILHYSQMRKFYQVCQRYISHLYPLERVPALIQSLVEHPILFY